MILTIFFIFLLNEEPSIGQRLGPRERCRRTARSLGGGTEYKNKNEISHMSLCTAQPTTLASPSLFFSTFIILDLSFSLLKHTTFLQWLLPRVPKTQLSHLTCTVNCRTPASKVMPRAATTANTPIGPLVMIFHQSRQPGWISRTCFST